MYPVRSRVILSVLLNSNIRVVDVTSQKVFNGIHKDMRGIRLDAYIHAAEGEEAEQANIYDIEAETRYADKKTLPQRSRYYSSLIDVHHLKTGAVFDDLPKLVIIMILSYDPFDVGDLYYEASTKLITHPKILYDDGIRRLYFYTEGNCNIPNDLHLYNSLTQCYSYLTFLENTSGCSSGFSMNCTCSTKPPTV